jgi:hypothetical protein
MPTPMDKYTYESAQERLSNLMLSRRLREKGITGKRAEGYEQGILAAKSLFSELFKPREGVN